MRSDDSPSTGPLLKLSHIDTYYGPIQILKDVNIEIHEGEIVYLLGTILSGGEQQMLAIARVLMSRPQLLLMDEPSDGIGSYPGGAYLRIDSGDQPAGDFYLYGGAERQHGPVHR